MAQKRRELRSIQDLTDKQKKFIDILVDNWGKITKTDALIESGYNTKTRESAMVLASKLTNPDINPHICRYLEKRLAEEREVYEKDKLRRYKILDDLRDQSSAKGQFTASINAEYRSGQLAGLYVDHKQITHSTLEGMSRDQLEKRLAELENKIGEAKNIIDVTPEKIQTK
jgi:phage terminase small subunit|tara:strand:+ start:427 stop:939 length:513 start_codon:yes stop_codon:yes gene_type:complete